jgi:hypothetical protein
MTFRSQSVKSPKSRQEAHKLWAKTTDSESRVISIIANLVEPRDRVQAARYVLTGEFPLMDDQQRNDLIASVTMFNCNDGILLHAEVILTKYQRENTAFLDSIYKFLEDAISKVCTKT